MIVKGRNEIIGIIMRYLDTALYFMYATLIFLSMIESAVYRIQLPIALYKFTNFFTSICLIYSLVKIWLYFDKDRRKSVTAMIFLTMAVILYLMGLCDYLLLVALIVAVFNSDYDRLIKFYTITVSVVLIVTFLCATTGVIKNISEYLPERRESAMYSLGFVSHNAFVVYYLFVSLAFIYITRKSKYQICVLILLSFISCVLYYFTASYTATILNILACLSVILGKVMSNLKYSSWASKVHRYFCYNLILSPIYSVIVTTIGVLFYNRFQRTILDGTLISRYYILDTALEIAGARLPFQTIDPSEVSKEISFNWLLGTGTENGGGGDILYGRIFLNDGLVVLFVYVFIHVFMLYSCYKRKEFEMLVILSVVAVLGAIESVALDFKFYIFELVLFSRWWNPDVPKRYKKSARRRRTNSNYV